MGPPYGCDGVAVAQLYSKKQVNLSGKLLVALRRDLRNGDDEAVAAYDVGEVDRASQAIDWWRSLHGGPLARVNVGLRYYLSEVHDETPTQRLKKFSTILDKLEREPNMQVTTMHDVGGVRAILPTQKDVEAVVTRLKGNWGTPRPGRTCIHKMRDYVREAKPDGYRAVHVIVRTREGYFIEIQLRKPWQDAWAQSMEHDTRRLREGLKFGSGPDDLRQYYALISELLATRERNEEVSEEFMEQLANLYRATRRYFPGDDGTMESDESR